MSIAFVASKIYLFIWLSLYPDFPVWLLCCSVACVFLSLTTEDIIALLFALRHGRSNLIKAVNQCCTQYWTNLGE